ncbi:MAG: threonine synthase [Ruminococcaceae bacterium]|nr:threonine synthase [Oscillospiraceae bacterium]
MDNLMYKSTRGSKEYLTSAEAIKRGLAEDGGLYMPLTIPKIDLDFIGGMVEDTYSERAFKVLSLYLTDYDKNTLHDICKKAYSDTRFIGGAAPVTSLNDKLNVLELWHGPTCAFKDMALQIMPMLLSEALKMTGEKKDALILVATSGDTGKAALEGYRDVDKIRIMVFYPENGVSAMQKLQMASQEGENVNVVAIKGNFDDAQTGVKEIFASSEIAEKLLEKNTFLSSANSINWGRLVPQIAYYFSAYCDMVKSGKTKLGEKVTFVVPTGNFGNIFAAHLARQMGLPINKLVCASNKNSVLTDFIENGVYDKNREFYTTISPSMDILVSSNVERLLSLISGENGTYSYMDSLKTEGKYTLTEEEKNNVKLGFKAGFTTEEETNFEIRDTFEKYNYLIDTHTAVAMKCAKDYLKDSQGEQVIVVSTASPYKFASSVIEALGKTCELEAVLAPEELESLTKKEIPLPLVKLHEKRIRFKKSIDKNQMAKEVLEF